jgi:hypothetical protein
VSTGVAKTRESVIFSIEHDQLASLAKLDFKRGLETICLSRYLEVEILQEIADVVMGLELLKVVLWVFVDLELDVSLVSSGGSVINTFLHIEAKSSE